MLEIMDVRHEMTQRIAHNIKKAELWQTSIMPNVLMPIAAESSNFIICFLRCACAELKKNVIFCLVVSIHKIWPDNLCSYPVFWLTAGTVLVPALLEVRLRYGFTYVAQAFTWANCHVRWTARSLKIQKRLADRYLLHTYRALELRLD